jgi:hypothetical protein
MFSSPEGASLQVARTVRIGAGSAVVDWLIQRPEIDAARIGRAGTNFGSLFGCWTVDKLPLISTFGIFGAYWDI